MKPLLAGQRGVAPGLVVTAGAEVAGDEIEGGVASTSLAASMPRARVGVLAWYF